MKHNMRLIRSTGVAFLESEKYLHENFPNYILSDKVLLCFALLDQLSHISILAVLHDNEKLLLFLFYNFFVVLNNVCMPKFRQSIYFANQLLLFSFLHPSVVNLFPTEDLAIADSLYFVNRAKTSLADFFKLCILIHIMF